MQFRFFLELKKQANLIHMDFICMGPHHVGQLFVFPNGFPYQLPDSLALAITDCK
jgi:hypothetical protein